MERRGCDRILGCALWVDRALHSIVCIGFGELIEATAAANDRVIDRLVCRAIFHRDGSWEPSLAAWLQGRSCLISRPAIDWIKRCRITSRLSVSIDQDVGGCLH